MTTRFVDNTAYFGPDRRRRSGKRLLDRRRVDEAGEPPSLAALLRRLRIRVSGATSADRRHALDMLEAAINEASRLGWRQCAAALTEADQALRTGGVQGAAIAEACVVRAMEHAGTRS